MGFLDGVWRDRSEILFQVPGAAGLGRAKRCHDLDQTLDIAGGFHGADLASPKPTSQAVSTLIPNWLVRAT
jgi:hypothetical protein